MTLRIRSHRNKTSTSPRFLPDTITAWEVKQMGTILLVVLILLLLGALPTWPHSRSWGYYPSGGLGLVVIILLILVLSGRL